MNTARRFLTRPGLEEAYYFGLPPRADFSASRAQFANQVAKKLEKKKLVPGLPRHLWQAFLHLFLVNEVPE